MPELPEVETVRRGLEPVMQGARFASVEARRPDLRWPLPPDFAARLQGQTVTGLGRRAKYLLLDLSSGEVLLMHLGMSGSFRVSHDGGSHEARQLSSGATATCRPRPCGVPHVERRRDRVQRSAPLRLHEAGAAREARRRAAVARARARAARQCVRRRHAGARLPGQEDQPQGGAAGSAGGGGARQHLRLRGALARAPVAQAPRLHHRDALRRAERARASRWSRASAPCSRMRSGPAALRCAITGAPTASSACSSISSRSTTAKASAARAAAAAAPSSASCKADARPSSARCASGEGGAIPLCLSRKRCSASS